MTFKKNPIDSGYYQTNELKKFDFEFDFISKCNSLVKS